MARIHARKKGKHSSKKPLRKNKPIWVKYKPKEIEELVVQFAKNGHQSSKIGLMLRDSYGIPNVRLVSGKKISKILIENKVYSELPEDLFYLLTLLNINWHVLASLYS